MHSHPCLGQWQVEEKQRDGQRVIRPAQEEEEQVLAGQWRPFACVVDRKGGKPPAKVVPNQFEKKWNGPCTNHELPVKYLINDYSLLRKFFQDS